MPSKAILSLQGVKGNCSWRYRASPDSPGPAKEGRCSTGEGHYPGESDAHHGVGRGEAEISHGLADDDVAFDGQDHQGPQGNLACGREGGREGGRVVVVRAPLGLCFPSWAQRRAAGMEGWGISKG